ncbi:hypothetical protein J7L48_04240 [bacterium]|nr:hypothetical protein [bacterium]
MKANKNDIYLVKGPSTIILKNGLFEVIGANYDSGNISIHEGKQIPIIVKEEGELDINGGSYEKLDHSTIPEKWYEIPKLIKEKSIKKILILGEVDTGKSFFTTFIANQLGNLGVSVGAIDTDTGQSDIGAPGTIGFGIFNKPHFNLSDVKLDKQFFIGNLSPGGGFSIFLAGISKILRYALSKVDSVIVDTTGWVHGDGGRAIKRSKLDIVDPDLVILLQRGRELEHLVQHIDRSKIIDLKVSKKASNTSQEVRKSLREEISRRYFENGGPITFDFNKVLFDRVYTKSGVKMENDNLDILYLEKLPAWEGTVVVFPDNINKKRRNELLGKFGKSIWYSPKYLKDIFVGLSDENGFCLSVGIIESIDFVNGKISIYLNKKDCEKDDVRLIQFGSIRYNNKGEEAGFVIPGSI